MSAEAPVEIRPGLWSIPVAIPIPSLRTVNVYVLEHPDRSVTLIDTGWDGDDSWHSLMSGLRRLGRAPTDVASVVVTHAHPDHLGLAHRLRAASGADVLVHETEAARLAGPVSYGMRFRTSLAAQLPVWGVPVARGTGLFSASAHISEDSWLVPVTGIVDGARLDVPGHDVVAVWTPGHTPGHLCLHDRAHGLVFTGDHVLPRITPAIGALPGDDSDMLGTFLGSLDRLAGLDADGVLPGHGARFSGLASRIGELRRHHERRLAEVEGVVRSGPGRTAWELAGDITWSRPLEAFDGPMVRAAVAETVAHLVHLERSGRVRRTPGNPAQRWFPC